MNGAESLLRTAANCGVDACFANPGTTELHLVEALDRVPSIRPVLALFEGVCTGAADGYARMTGGPALTVTHLGPGFANGLANVHNARRARTPMINLIGDHATWHLAADAPLASDIETLARPMSGWVRRTASAGSLSQDMLDAVDAAYGATRGGGAATLIIAQDHCWDESTMAATATATPARQQRTPSQDQVATATSAIRKAQLEGRKVFMVLGGSGLGAASKRVAARLGSKAGLTVLTGAPNGRADRGGHVPAIAAIPYFPEQAQPLLADAGLVVLAGAIDPVQFFGYPGGRSRVAPDGVPVVVLAQPGEDVLAGLGALADELGVTMEAIGATDRGQGFDRPVAADGPLTLAGIGSMLWSRLPEGAIVVSEAISSSGQIEHEEWKAAPHTSLAGTTGGAIGGGLPLTVGAAVACPDRKVIDLQADGSAAYTVQSLWTMARESLDVVVVLLANRRYNILDIELKRSGMGAGLTGLTDLGRPDIGWAKIAEGFGVAGIVAHDSATFAKALERGLRESGPLLIEAVI